VILYRASIRKATLCIKISKHNVTESNCQPDNGYQIKQDRKYVCGPYF